MRLVIDELHRSQKATAIEAGCADSDFSAALSGKQRFDIDWVIGQDDAFVLSFVDALLKSRNLTPQNQRAARLKLAATLFQQLVDLVEEA